MTEPMVFSGARRISLADVKLRAAKLASGLTSLGIVEGDRYAIILRNEPAYIETSIAAPFVGAVPVPVNWHWTGADLEHLLSDSGVKVAFVHTDLVPGVEAHRPDGLQIVEVAVPPELVEAYDLGEAPLTGRYPTLEELIDQNDPATTPVAPPMAVIYTSGTTGLAKGILRNQVPPEDSAKLVRFMSELMAFEPGGINLAPAPLYHTAPNVSMIFAVATDMTIVLMPKFDPEEFLRLVEKHRVSSVQMVPTMFVRLLQLPEDVRTKYDLSSLKTVVHAAAPCPQDVKRAMIEWFGPIVTEYYGGSEGGTWVFCDSEEWLAHPGTVGRPVSGAAIKILGPDMQEVPVGETGVIYGRAVDGWPDFTYIGNEEKRRSIDAGDGFITVGDLGHVDQDGFLYLSDRLNDMIISGGVNIYPAEIEACLTSLPGVADVAVFGIPDPDMGEAIAAHVQPLPGATLSEDQVRDHVRRNLAGYKAPKVVVFDPELPREDSGKLFKRRIKEKYWPTKTGV